ncbi:MAG TPA: MtrB/PioB family outer membrane beta-barrel protein [Thermoanaerobaculia bacterium]|nr:MtrB/PioB family outer membrane beta-barrel protein [Thermoanaerobaculia bacterium]
MKKLTVIIALILFPSALLAQAENMSEVVTAVQGVDQVDSAKFNEYRDLDTGFYLYSLRYRGYEADSARFLELRGNQVGRDDQHIAVEAGKYGSWGVTAEWNSLVHRLTNDAFSPYSFSGKNRLVVPEVVGILTTTADGRKYLNPDAAVNDQKIASFLSRNLHELPELGTQRQRGTLVLQYAPAASIEARLSLTQETKEGEKISYGPIGDRPPRTLGVEIPEPIDTTSRELHFEAAWAARRVDVQFEFSAPTFENDIDTFVWQNMYAGPDSDGAADYNNDVILAGAVGTNDIFRRAVSTFGQRALFPDNNATNAMLTVGFGGPMSGRGTVTAALGRMEQDQDLLPYSYSSLTKDWNSVAKLPRLSAGAEINTTLVDAQYDFKPAARFNVRPYFRSYKLDDDTPEARWQYVTQDAASPTGGVSYKNKRVNLRYGFERRSFGIETTWAPARTANFGLVLQRESVDRDHREAQTDENMLRATASLRPLSWLNLRARYTFGDRNSSEYDWRSAASSYWYDPAEVNDHDNPRFTFYNHPDLRRFDVSDRRRRDFDLSASLTPAPALGFSISWATRDDDYDSDVRPVRPMAGTGFESEDAQTLGRQLGLLARSSGVLSFDANWAPGDRYTLTAFASIEAVDTDQRGMGFNEDRKMENQALYVGQAGQAFIDPANIWDTKGEDRTRTLGIGGSFAVIPERLDVFADYAYSRGTTDLHYSGFGADAPLTTAYYAFRTPETAEHTQHTANVRFEYRVSERIAVGLRYLYEEFDTTDWMQGPIGGWAETVGSDYFLRDTTRDNRWGNRFVRMAGYLAPSYSTNVASLTVRYIW